MAGKILDMIPTCVSVITCKRDDKLNGITLAWVTQVSFDPPLVAISVAPQRFSHDMILDDKQFVINVLAEGDIETGKKFGTASGRDRDKMEGVEYETQQTGVPILKTAVAFLECRLVDSFTAGDHTIFVGEVLNCAVQRDAPGQIFKTKDYFG